MIARLTWQPADADAPETLTVDLPPERVAEMRELIGTEAWTSSGAVMQILCQWRPESAWDQRLFRLARITGIEPA